MGFWQLVLLEGLLLLAAGINFIGGMLGTLTAALILSWINLSSHTGTDFWIWEVPLLFGLGVGILVSGIITRKSRQSPVFSVLAGGVLSLVVFGAFFTPFLALLIWALTIGTGLMPRFKKVNLFWGLAPTLWRAFLGISIIVYGNLITI